MKAREVELRIKVVTNQPLREFKELAMYLALIQPPSLLSIDIKEVEVLSVKPFKED
jgi:hypothetical protein